MMLPLRPQRPRRKTMTARSQGRYSLQQKWRRRRSTRIFALYLFFVWATKCCSWFLRPLDRKALQSLQKQMWIDAPESKFDPRVSNIANNWKPILGLSPQPYV